MRHFSPWRSTFFKAVSVTILALSISLPALAVPGRITGATPGSRVNIRTQPSTSASSPGYGLVGDRVEVIRSTTRDGFPWHYVRFPQSGVEGWINGNFIQVLEEPDQQPSRWSHTYTCGPYTVTLAETGRDQYSYRSRSDRGNLELANGRRIYSGSSWNYEFTNSNTVYVLEDAWNSPRFPNGFAELRVSQNGQSILRQTCRK
ncbi:MULTISPECIES: SH3 domain-containing protein [unclassified Leptolyngbya]|uniref:SH3 domain-containing protein n=1 Tax=unclassified Leptolyngbya TaxID=2650499 RepID=UPI001682DE89|nr:MULTISPECIES: SH3 domain-containing protein [unclassified Leptolyngbya]MBD1912846.1 SH3 domain-containing protein [Leptolyngbya sp. FACHB-8]MBD2153122.1 SH3 domain-containing protein [Leptolyngbya sp. FACHB-16]